MPLALSDVPNDFATLVFQVEMFGKSARTAQTFAGAAGIFLLTLIDRIVGFSPWIRYQVAEIGDPTRRKMNTVGVSPSNFAATPFLLRGYFQPDANLRAGPPLRIVFAA